MIWEVIEESISLRYECNIANSMIKDIDFDYELLSDSNYGMFSKFHKEFNKESYWTLDLIMSKIDKWCVVMRKDQRDLHSASGAILYVKDNIHHAEIYFSDSRHDDISILLALMTELIKRNMKRVVFMITKESQSLMDVLESMGFQYIDDYFGYKTTL